MRRWRVVCGVLLALSACRQLVGIEDAQVDPALGGSGGQGDALTMGGSRANAAGLGSDDVGGAGSLPGGSDAGASDSGGGGLPEPASAGAAGQGGASDEPTLCDQYCTAVMANCTAAFAVYTSYATCLSVCAALPEGALGARTGNSVQCRLRAAVAAKDEVPHYCPIAGPGGNGVCGSNCESLCGLRGKVCSKYGTVTLQTCLSDCAKLQDLGNYSTSLDVGQYKGAHVQCRLYHASAAAADDPEQHCPHADGAPPCQ